MREPLRLTCATPEDTRDLGRRLGAVLHGGDVVVLTGSLGAGKTTLVQGLARGLGVTGPVTSPTFVLARHQRVDPRGPRPDGPDLVHVDAYRLAGALELDDLDLDSDLDRSVVVVEWGEGVAERLSPDRIELRLERPVPGDDGGDRVGDGGSDGGSDVASDATDGAEAADEPRVLHLQGFGRLQDTPTLLRPDPTEHAC